MISKQMCNTSNGDKYYKEKAEYGDRVGRVLFLIRLSLQVRLGQLFSPEDTGTEP